MFSPGSSYKCIFLRKILRLGFSVNLIFTFAEIQFHLLPSFWSLNSKYWSFNSSHCISHLHSSNLKHFDIKLNFSQCFSPLYLKFELRYFGWLNFYILSYDKLGRSDCIGNMQKHEIFEAGGIFDMLAPLRIAEWGFAHHFGPLKLTCLVHGEFMCLDLKEIPDKLMTTNLFIYVLP